LPLLFVSVLLVPFCGYSLLRAICAIVRCSSFAWPNMVIRFTMFSKYAGVLYSYRWFSVLWRVLSVSVEL
jgi:hypothetical protein